MEEHELLLQMPLIELYRMQKLHSILKLLTMECKTMLGSSLLMVLERGDLMNLYRMLTDMSIKLVSRSFSLMMILNYILFIIN